MRIPTFRMGGVMRRARHFLSKLAISAGMAIFFVEALSAMFGQLAAMGFAFAFLGWCVLPTAKPVSEAAS